MIDEALLMKFGAVLRSVKKGAYIFEEGTYPGFYYQILEGKVKMNNFTEDGKEFIQNIFIKGQSFGESPLFIDEAYPANAMAVTHATVLELPKTSFYELLQRHPEVSFQLNKILARRLHYKSIMAPEISSQSPENRIWTLLKYLQKRAGVEQQEFLIDLSRQQLADLTGLRVETVIRTIKQLEKRKKLKIREGKIILEC